jgi:hypothetical protein
MRSHRLWIAVASLALVGGSAGLARADKEKPKADEKKADEKEVKMSIEDVPAAVRKTIKREAAGAKVETVDKEQREGKTVYEADAEIDGVNYEILIDAKGKLLSKKIDEEAETTGKPDKVEKKGDKEAKSGKSAKDDEDGKKSNKELKAGKSAKDDGDERPEKKTKVKAKGDDEEKSDKKAKKDKDDDETPSKKSKSEKEEK